MVNEEKDSSEIFRLFNLMCIGIAFAIGSGHTVLFGVVMSLENSNSLVMHISKWVLLASVTTLVVSMHRIWKLRVER